ncbi:MAG: hypothetical protein ACFFFC_07900 [Candidatus Thorarchaeota archaeon]
MNQTPNGPCQPSIMRLGTCILSFEFKTSKFEKLEDMFAGIDSGLSLNPFEGAMDPQIFADELSQKLEALDD